MTRTRLVKLGKPLIAAAMFALLLPGCSEQAEEFGRIKRVNSGDFGAPSAPLPLDRQTHRDVTGGQNGRTSRTHWVTMGNWMVNCFYLHAGGGQSAIASCDVAPFSGEVLAGQPIPVPNMAVVEFARNQKPRLSLVLYEPEPGTQWSYECGNRQFGTGDARKGRTMLDEGASAAFISVMKTRDCSFVYVPQGAGETLVSTNLSHGFDEAERYARQYVASPQ